MDALDHATTLAPSFTAMSIRERAPGGIRAIAADILLNTAAPYAAFLLLRHDAVSEPRALIASALIPVAISVSSIIRRRRVNGLSLLVIAASALVLVAVLLSGSTWFALVQPSFVTGGLALGFLGSLALSRPVLFYLARDTTCPTAEAAREFEAKWVLPGFRRSMRRLTIVWASFLGGEALFRLVLVSIWPSPGLAAATQILWIILPVLLVRWSIRAGARWSAQ